MRELTAVFGLAKVRVLDRILARERTDQRTRTTNRRDPDPWHHRASCRRAQLRSWRCYLTLPLSGRRETVPAVREKPGAANERDEAYRAIGRYVVDFSIMVACMKMDMTARLASQDDSNRILAAIAFGEATAKHVSDAFFAMCLAAGECDEDEARIVDKLLAKVNEEIARRNDFADGDWWLGYGGLNTSMALARYKPPRKLSGSLDLYSPGALDQAAKYVRQLTGWIVETGGVCLDKSDPRRLHDYFAIEGRQLVRLPLQARVAACSARRRRAANRRRAPAVRCGLAKLRHLMLGYRPERRPAQGGTVQRRDREVPNIYGHTSSDCPSAHRSSASPRRRLPRSLLGWHGRRCRRRSNGHVYGELGP